jgi:hypothetical protein
VVLQQGMGSERFDTLVQSRIELSKAFWSMAVSSIGSYDDIPPCLSRPEQGSKLLGLFYCLLDFSCHNSIGSILRDLCEAQTRKSRPQSLLPNFQQPTKGLSLLKPSLMLPRSSPDQSRQGNLGRQLKRGCGGAVPGTSAALPSLVTLTFLHRPDSICRAF